MVQPGDEEEASGPTNTYSPLGIPIHPRPVNVAAHQRGRLNIFCVPPFIGPLLFDNTDSDARDHCANERTFLSYLRLSLYMSIVAVAIVISFHLKSKPTRLELRMAKPLGIIFWVLSVACLCLGVGNYVKTVNKYSRRAAIVQTGWKTQSVSSISRKRRGRANDVLAGFDGRGLCYWCRLHTLSGDEFEEILRKIHTWTSAVTKYASHEHEFGHHKHSDRS
ncbi:hypothetical protein LARI1_G003097 [Lachnellula arida]|uniref:DUF202 domain-containing protein n=1 Tax=Lachnellula arida TaxID=1316785 RepID=A0A8T9BHQ7_9HELO|nr:hypothetical protein LARI1_G003097 [Lachnellula arida]